MVLQRDKPIKLWGWAEPNEKITVQFVAQNYNIKADSNGDWVLILKPMPAGGPYQLKINELQLDDILMGDVFLCSGQSNMAFQLQNAKGGKQDVENANHPQIRLFTVPREIEFKENKEIAGKASWQVCNPENVAKFSAVAYYMAQILNDKLDVPIGLVHSSYGGTVIEGFLTEKALDTIDRYRAVKNDIKSRDKTQYMAGQLKNLTDRYGKIVTYNATEELWDTIKPIIPVVDAAWKAMNLPTLWEKAGLPYVDGVIWFYKEVKLTAEEAKQPAFLSLGRIADQSVSYINGQKLGSSPDSRDFLRSYKVPAKLLNPGINHILVRVANKGRNGGIWGPSSQLYFETSNAKKIPLAGEWKIKIQLAKIAIHPNDVPSSIYNAMIYPLKDIQYKAVIWYQGESNANWANEYEDLLTRMIKDWRAAFNQVQLPFVIIQLPNYKKEDVLPNEHITWALLREAQENSTRLPNVSLVETIDMGDANDIHPIDKKPVGERMAKQVFKLAYNHNVVANGPVFKSMRQEQDKMIVEFYNSSGLHANTTAVKSNFMIAGQDQVFKWAKAKIDGEKVVVWSEEVKKPVAIRYAWADNPGLNYLYNGENLPARPFRTDKWKFKLENIDR